MRTKNALITSVNVSSYKCLFTIVLLFVSLKSFSQTVVQQNFSGIMVPQFMAATGTNTRLPMIFRAKVSGLSPNSTYKYYVQGITSADFATTNSGSGAAVLINAVSSSYTITSSPGLSTAGTYETFTTDASGTYTGWFGMMNTTGTRFTAGNDLYPTLTLNNGNGGTTPAYRFALDQSVKVISIGTTAGSTYGTGIWGSSSATAKNMVALYDNISGAGRPLAITYVEDEGATSTSLPTFYANNVNAKNGTWGTLIPNTNANGVRKIEQFSLSTGSSIGCVTDADGVWPTGNINTVNPTGGSTALQISGTDAPLNTSCGNTVSSLSDISASNTFAYPENINYTNYQEATDINLSNSTSVNVASFDLRDGGGSNDADDLTTTLTSITFNITNPGFIRRAALYNGNTELAEVAVTGSSITFSGFSLTAADNGSETLTLRVSYTQNVTDNAQNIFTISSATADNTGSGFASVNAGESASSSFNNINRIEVTASKLGFITEASVTATIYKLLSIMPIISAQDVFNNTDLDFNGQITLINSANLTAINNTATAVNGVANFPLMLFQQAGTTSLQANTNGLTSANSTESIVISDAKKWDGGAGTNYWADANNWADNIAPVSTDVVILDNSYVSTTYAVVLPDVATSVNYLKINPTGTNTITLTLPATNIACPGFTIGDNAAGTEDLVIENGGIFINAAGCSTGQGLVINAQTSTTAVKINAGGKYIHRNAKSHTELLDAAVFDENSTLVFDVNASTSYVISISNRTLGNITLSAASKGTTQAYSSNYAAAANIKGNFTVENKASLSLSGNGHLYIGGNIISDGSFSTGNTSRKLVMNGTKAQAFSGAGTYAIKMLEISNSYGVTLNVPIKLNNTSGSGLILTNGNLYTTTSNALTLQDLTTITGGSKSSFVSGPIIKTFNTTSAANIMLPIGKDTLYRPVTITPESIASISTFSAEYFNTSAGYDLSKHDGNLTSVNNNEYWTINRTAGTTNAALTFIWGESSSINDPSAAKIARWDGSQWVSELQNDASGTSQYGTITTGNLTALGTFTLAKKYIAPLPVSWLYFTAKTNEKDVLLNWATASEINNNGFEIQRSVDGENFEVIGWINGNGTTNMKHFYGYTDMGAANMSAKVIYYRLKQTDFNGTYELSHTEAVRKQNSKDLTKVSIYADAQKSLHIQLYSDLNAGAQLQILTLNGQIIHSSTVNASTGNNVLYIPMNDKVAGIYLVQITQNGTLYSQKFVLP